MNELKMIGGLRSIGDMLVDALAFELSQQGHNNTGKLIESIVCEVRMIGNVLQLDLYFEKYGIYVDKGVAANKIPFGKGTGAKSSKYIRALMRWVTERGMTTSLKKAKSIAFAIAKTHKKEGMPTRNSYLFSRNGRRKDFFSNNYVFDKVEDRLMDIVEQEVTVLIDDAINNVQQFINKSKTKAA